MIDLAGKKMLFPGDHILRQDWITAAGIRLAATLHLYKHQARETSGRICAFVKELPMMVLPSLDPDAVRIAAEMRVVQL